MLNLSKCIEATRITCVASDKTTSILEKPTGKSTSQTKNKPHIH